MTLRIRQIFGAAALLAFTAPAQAGSCAGQIDRAQVTVDARIDAVAGAGPFAAESEAARLHRQPTPGSIAGAEGRLGEGAPVGAARAALARARAADSTGDLSGCESALGEVRRALR